MAYGATSAAPPEPPPFGFQVRTLDATAARAVGRAVASGAAERGSGLVTAVGTGCLAEAAGLRPGNLLAAPTAANCTTALIWNWWYARWRLRWGRRKWCSCSAKVRF
jgi:hypothetical protein